MAAFGGGGVMAGSRRSPRTRCWMSSFSRWRTLRGRGCVSFPRQAEIPRTASHGSIAHSSRPAAAAYHVTKTSTGVNEQRLTARYLG
jgi:hypothetical protein